MIPPQVTEIAPADVRARLGDADFMLLDCREANEVAIARISGSVNIPMGDIPGRLPHLDPDQEIVVHCHHGVRSQKVARWLMEQGFTNVKSMRGGIDAWSLEVNPGVPRY
jgi:rhodanese-related sulfurtransferase